MYYIKRRKGNKMVVVFYTNLLKEAEEYKQSLERLNPGRKYYLTGNV